MPTKILYSDDKEIDAFLNVFNMTEERYLDWLSKLEFTQADADTLSVLGEKLAERKTDFNGSIAQHLSDLFHASLPADTLGSHTLPDEQIFNFHFQNDKVVDKFYIRRRIAACLNQRKNGQPFNWYLLAYAKYQEILSQCAIDLCHENFNDFIFYMHAISKIMLFDIGLVSDVHFYEDNYLTNKYQPARSGDLNAQLTNESIVKTVLTQLFQVNPLTTLTLIKLSIDNFKALGVEESPEEGVVDGLGERIAKDLGAQLRHYLPKDDLVECQRGGIFYVVARNNGEIDEATRLCNKISEVVSSTFIVDNKAIHVTCSMGVALFPRDCQGIDDLIKFSDSALTMSKEMGGNRYQFFNGELDAQLTLRTVIENELSHAIESNQFHLYYQAVTDLQSGTVIGMEALIRWIHPDRGFIPPHEFISIAEDLSIINILGDWINREVCSNIRNWRAKGINVPRISINISPNQLQDPLFTHNLIKTMAEFGIDPHNITLEITENLLINHGDEIGIALKKIKAYGFNLAMDDFGTGYSALSYLKHYPFDYVKIDQSFIRDIIENSGDAAITNAVIAMAHSMGMKVIAEGVESAAQCEYLSKNMCDYVQGYLVSKPLPELEAGEFISSSYTLPENLRRFVQVSRTLLLVDDEVNILSSLKRLFRKEGYQILTANSGLEGLEILKKQSVDVIISDQRMPVMTGVEFLRQAKLLRPDTVRIVLSGYTELESITNAINEGAIYKFLTKPWNDDQLREQIMDAFRQKELTDHNRRLGMEIGTANQELALVNRHLESVLQEKEKQVNIGEKSLDIAHEALECIPIPMIGIDDNEMIAFVNLAAKKLFDKKIALLGENIDELLPNFSITASINEEGVNFSLSIPDFDHLICFRKLGTETRPRGKLVIFSPE